MSISDQDQAVDTPIPVPEAGSKAGSEATSEAKAETEPRAETATEPETEAETATVTGTVAGAETEPGLDTEPELETQPGADEDTEDRKLTPRQARRLRMVLSSVGMAAMAVVLALRIASRSSVLVVGVYGLALILCGIVIELSRNGRTRLGSWLLAVGLVAAIGSDWLLIP
ncbi:MULTISPECIES: hypothetical protein [unclassified Streptomyces]|uniref:hypothetical protein n=1 Tax=unclassified Streptomyces TaxID=2593676 RepID=UPI000F9ECD6A|nr:hypothetical protein [Streptomyces sp. ADI95-17]RPK65216.1 hypothetical protein EES42_25310 [Streptomyces sp. ADI95-17]WSG54780.1 hypothetical protein OHA38_35930 [Streptomyces sp. NBC_01732]WSX05497.1 hypothetical protein OG355_36375 [Streptomyces sp. NBC_00987]